IGVISRSANIGRFEIPPWPKTLDFSSRLPNRFPGAWIAMISSAHRRGDGDVRQPGPDAVVNDAHQVLVLDGILRLQGNRRLIRKLRANFLDSRLEFRQLQPPLRVPDDWNWSIRRRAHRKTKLLVGNQQR